MHRDPMYYPDPDSFIPERWSNDKGDVEGLNPWMPFGGGARVCLGYAVFTLEELQGGGLPEYNTLPSQLLRPRDGEIGADFSNIDQKSQKFVPVLDSGESISTLALSPDRHIIAVTESSNVPVITIYDLPHFRKRRVLHANVSESSTVQEFISVVFSSDSKYIAAQLGSPEWLLHYYSWEKGKLVACEKTLSRGDNANSFLRKPSQIVQIGLNPDDGTLISVLSDIGLCLYRYCEGSFNCEEFNYLPDEIYKAHCWLDSEVIALGTSQSGKIIIVNQATRTILSEIKIDSEFTPNRISIAQSSQQSQLSNISINWILKTNYGFICSGRNSHVVFNFQKKTLASNSSNETNPTDSQAGSDATLVAFRQIKSLMIPDENLEITAVAVSAAETSLLCQVSTNQLFRIALPSVNQSGKKDSQECQKLDPISQPFHHGTITGLDLCIRKPLLITCSPTDKSVRIYNYLTNTCELLKYFPEEAYSVAFHPSGLYALVGFSDKLRFMNVMIDELRVFREFGIRGCRECKFSNGGNVFAAISGSIIQLYSTWSFDNIANLKGHNGKVKSLFWTPDDSILVSCGSDGAVYSWNIRDLKRENEHILKSCSYTCAVCTPSGRSLYAVGSDKTLKEITDSTVSFEINCANVTPTQVVISHSGRMMFVGTSSGHVRAIRYPFSATLNNNASNANGENEYQQHVAHSSPVTKMRISYDDSYLFTVSEDGSLISFKISDREDRGIKRDRTLIFSDEVKTKIGIIDYPSLTYILDFNN
ncbi:Cilia- and flagella-associated protein 57 [Nowakowskiella sp. JEL0407]|nr:Cilia- and flagella-associated protein 57 [Nowakowskiella sp. JEL0407]